MQIKLRARKFNYIKLAIQFVYSFKTNFKTCRRVVNAVPRSSGHSQAKKFARCRENFFKAGENIITLSAHSKQEMATKNNFAAN